MCRGPETYLVVPDPYFIIQRGHPPAGGEGVLSFFLKKEVLLLDLWREALHSICKQVLLHCMPFVCIWIAFQASPYEICYRMHWSLPMLTGCATISGFGQRSRDQTVLRSDGGEVTGGHRREGEEKSES